RGGRIALIDSLPDPQSGAADRDPVATDDRSLRRLADGREVTVIKVYRSPEEIAAALTTAGLVDVAVTSSGRLFLLPTRGKRWFVLATGTKPSSIDLRVRFPVRYSPDDAPQRANDRDRRLRRDGRGDDRRPVARRAGVSRADRREPSACRTPRPPPDGVRDPR